MDQHFLEDLPEFHPFLNWYLPLLGLYCEVVESSHIPEGEATFMIENSQQLALTWRQLVHNKADRVLLGQVINILDEQYDLVNKIAREPGTKAIIEQLLGRLVSAFAELSALAGKRVLDIACGSNSSQAPPILNVNTPLQTTTIHNAVGNTYTTQFEPWFCRILLALAAEPVGIDFGDLSSEAFEHYRVDLIQPGALDFLPSHSFDAAQDSRLFGSPEFTALLPDRAERLKVAREIRDQEQRLLKEGGILIHSDAAHLVDSSKNRPA